MRPASPYLVPGFYDRALAQGRHRDIVGGRWDETGRAQMALLLEAGMRPGDRLLDVGAGSLRLGCLAVPWLDAGNYWATDASGALMRHGRGTELADPDRLPEANLIEDGDFAYPGVPADMDWALAFAVFAHLPQGAPARALASARARFPALRAFLFTVFLAPDAQAGKPVRQADGVVTHADRPPYHLTRAAVEDIVRDAGFRPEARAMRLPRGQALFAAWP